MRGERRESGERGGEKTILERLGGLSGIGYAVTPVGVFVLVNGLFGLMPAIVTALGVAVALSVVRLIRGGPMYTALAGLFSVGVASFVAYRTGSAKNYFLLGIWASFAAAWLFLLSVVVRRPLAGVLWSKLNGLDDGWRRDRVARRYYDVATLVWFVVFASRFVVQRVLYNLDQVGWLGFARITMSAPLMAVAFLATIWAVRRAAQRQKDLTSG